MSSYNICSNLIKLCLVIISALELKSTSKKKLLLLTVQKPFGFSQNYSVPFHRVTFNHSIL